MIDHLGPFTVFELRRYTTKAGEQASFATYFETYFPEAFQQLGALVCGHFHERGNAASFTWLRGYASMESRAVVNASFYYGPVWREHKATLNDRLVDWTNVLLLRPLGARGGVPVLPAVDPLREPDGARGLVFAHLFAVKAEALDDIARDAETIFPAPADGGRAAGLLATLDAFNNFPQHPVRTDGPHVVWLCTFEDDAALARFLPTAHAAEKALAARGWLRSPAEQVILEPAHRSRLRWMPPQ